MIIVRFVIEDSPEGLFLMWIENQEGATRVHVEQLTDCRGMIAIIGIRNLWVFPNEAGNTAVRTVERARPVHTSSVVFSEDSMSSIHA